ncbi:MAG: lipopolysaccharide heptosyltransferase II, partial [Acidobacteriota bacterium]|nr:lipopolysaccharide heptosyltransferase II [Acidobacteriota bacterium]
MGTLKQQNINRVIVRGTNWVGDAVMTIPAGRELRRLLPGAHITLAIKPWAKELFADADFLDELLIYDRRGPWSAVKQSAAWRRGNFDLAVLFPNAFEAALIPALARVPFRIGYATDGRSRLLTNPLPVPEWRSSKHEIYYYLNIVAELERALVGSKQIADGPPDASLQISEPRQSEAFDLLRAQGLREGRAMVALCPGSINSRAKRWPAERYGALADRLIEELNTEILLIGSSGELDVSQEVKRCMRNRPIIMTGKTSLAQVAAVLSLVDLLVTNDTGPAHIAGALGRPTLVIFGPTNPITTRPFSPLTEIVRHPPDCAPCMLRDCPIDHRCMTAISPQDVFQRAMLLLLGRTLAPATRHGSSLDAWESVSTIQQVALV